MNNFQKINRIVLFNIDSLVSAGAIRKIIEAFSDRIVLICSSQRYGGKYGSFLKQFKKNLRQSGLYFTNYLSLQFVLYPIFLYLFDIFNFIFNRPKKIYSLNQLARRHKIPIIKTKGINNPKIISLIKEKNPDLIISCFFDQVIGLDIIKISEYGVVNVHTAFLPYCKGPFPVLCSALKNNFSGITTHYVEDRALDTGTIIKQEAYPLNKEKSILSLDSEFLNIGADMIINTIKKIENGNIVPVKQFGDGFYMSYPNKNDIKELKTNGFKLFTIKEFLKFF